MLPKSCMVRGLFLSAALSVFLPGVVLAEEVKIGASLIWLSQETSGPSFGNNESMRQILNAKVGYLMSSGLYVGGIYDQWVQEVNNSEDKRTGYGATLGFERGGWFLHGSYFVSSKYETGANTFEKGSGFGLDVGRNFDLAANFYAGLQLSYRSFSYGEKNGVDETNKIKSEHNPMLNLGLKF